MSPDPAYQKLREISWRRPLTEAEQAELHAWLAAHPEAQADAEADAALSQVLAKLPDAPMPSNFTARILQAIERDATASGRVPAKTSAPWWRVLIPRIAAATVVLGVGAIAYRHNQAVQRAELADTAKDFVSVAGAAPMSDLTVIEDFEAIRRMSQADDGLLALSDDLMSLKQ
jgi:anti-sigma factor RsiW